MQSHWVSSHASDIGRFLGFVSASHEQAFSRLRFNCCNRFGLRESMKLSVSHSVSVNGGNIDFPIYVFVFITTFPYLSHHLKLRNAFDTLAGTNEAAISRKFSRSAAARKSHARISKYNHASTLLHPSSASFCSSILQPISYFSYLVAAWSVIAVHARACSLHSTQTLRQVAKSSMKMNQFSSRAAARRTCRRRNSRIRVLIHCAASPDSCEAKRRAIFHSEAC